ncbi:hypothetical protein C0J52_18840 [Blattella germanica]|nr:hypothetical protein C0J52_18840 [Blattella germanica]
MNSSASDLEANGNHHTTGGDSSVCIHEPWALPRSHPSRLFLMGIRRSYCLLNTTRNCK